MADTTAIELVNRTTKPLRFLFDGVPTDLRPGYVVKGNIVVPAGRDNQPATTHVMGKAAAEMARRQNPRMGTESRWNPAEVEYLVGVALRDPETNALVADPAWYLNQIDHVEQDTGAVERFDRSTMETGAQGAVAVPAAVGFPRGRGAAIEPLQYQDGPTGLDTRG